MKNFRGLLFLLFIVVLAKNCWADTPVYTYKIIRIYPHDPRAFTEGLAFENGFLFESTGLKGHSTLRKVALESGKILAQHKLADKFFGEGIAIVRGKIIQLTYRSHLGFVYNKNSFRLLKKFKYDTEGWGLTFDGRYLVMSDGTEKLYFLDPETFKLLYWIGVHDEKGPVNGLNELEFVQGEIFANIYRTERIARISPQTAEVTGWLNLEGILKAEKSVTPQASLNGIAYDGKHNRIFVTGKYYPKIFEIEVVGKN